MYNLGYLREVISSLEGKDLSREADEVRNIVAELNEEADIIVDGDQGIEDTLNAYENMHKVEGSMSQNVKVAIIRKGEECPFGLSIPQTCSYAGDSVLDMDPIDSEEYCAVCNVSLYNYERSGERCIYADAVMNSNKAVDCNYGTVLAGQKSIKMFHGNPQYPKMWSGFSGIALDRGYHAYSQQYGNELFPYPSIYG